MIPAKDKPKKSTHKKAFTLIELMVTVVIMAILTTLSIKAFISNKKSEEINSIIHQIVQMTQTYVLDTQIGYLNGNGGYCSDDSTFNKVDAYRAIMCAGFKDKPYYVKNYNSDDEEKNGTSNKCDYIIIPSKVLNITKTDDNNMTACRIHYDFNESNTLYVGINCSYIKNERKRQLLENLLVNAFKRNFPTIYEDSNHDWKVSSYTSSGCSESNTSGNKTDGEIQFTLKTN